MATDKDAGTPRIFLARHGMLIDPAKLALILISPMQRARKTYELMFAPTTRQIVLESKAIITPELTEWKYGDYEGLTTKEIRKLRESRGLNGKDWDHFRDGWSPEQVVERLDIIIERIREIHKPNMHGENTCDVLLVAHGHSLRSFVRRWLNYPIDFPLSAMLEPGGIGILSYQHHNINEPAFLLGMALP
ncbi:MAG: hypothetical protein Q9175_005963 [Cornicularia normoerica]